MIQSIRAIREKYFDTTVDLSKLSKTFLLWGTGLVLVYLSNIFLTRWIGLKQYGEYAVFMNWVALVSTFVTFGWDGYLVQKVPQLSINDDGNKEASTLFRRALLTFFSMYSLLIIMLCIAGHFFTFTLFYTGSSMMIIFLLLVFLFTGIAFFRSILKIFHQVSAVQWLEDISKPLLMLVIFGYFYYFNRKPGLTTVYLVNVSVFVGLMAGLYLLVLRKVGKSIELKGNRRTREKWLDKCFYFMCIMLGYSFFSRMELLFLGYYDKNEDAGKYQLLLRIADLVILPDFLFNYYLPQQFSHLFAEKDNAGAEKLFRNAARTIFFLQLICLAGISGLGYFYLQSFKIAGWEMFILLVILGSAQLFYSYFGSTNLVLMTSGNERFSFLALGMVIVLEVIANIIFIARYGLKAAVYISWGSVLVYTGILYYFVHKKLRFSSPFIARSMNEVISE